MRSIEPVQILDSNGQPLNEYGGTGQVIPHAVTFASILNQFTQTYSYRYDEALRHMPQNALAMRRDCYIRSLVNERKMPTAYRSWQLEVDNPKDPRQREVLEGMTAIVNRTPRMRRMFRYLMEAIWYGRYAAQVVWKKEAIDGQPRWIIASHNPVNGDKIQTSWDGTPVILINGSAVSKYPAESIVHGDRAPGLRLNRPEWRRQFILHTFEVDDADYLEGEMAGGVHGVGLRSLIYWAWWLRDEMLSWAVDFMKKVGTLGLLIFPYELSNKDSKLKAEENAQKASRDVALTMPVTMDGKFGRDMQPIHIKSDTHGIDALRSMIADYFERHMERLVVGQSMSSGGGGAGGLEGDGRANLANETKHALLEADAEDLADTVTEDWIKPAQKLNYPDADFPVRMKFNVPSPENQQKMAAVQQAWSMGVEFEEDSIRELTGLMAPKEGAKVISNKPPEQPGGMGGEQDDGSQPAGGEQDDDDDTLDDVGDIFDWEPTRGGQGRGEVNKETGAWRPRQMASQETPELYRAAGNDPGDWRPTRGGKGEYSPSTHRWRPAGSAVVQGKPADHEWAAKMFGSHRQESIQAAMKSASDVWNHPKMSASAKQRFLAKAAEHAPHLHALMSGQKLSADKLHAIHEEVGRLKANKPEFQKLVDKFKADVETAVSATENHAHASFLAKLPQPKLEPLTARKEAAGVKIGTPSDGPRTAKPKDKIGIDQPAKPAASDADTVIDEPAKPEPGRFSTMLQQRAKEMAELHNQAADGHNKLLTDAIDWADKAKFRNPHGYDLLHNIARRHGKESIDASSIRGLDQIATGLAGSKDHADQFEHGDNAAPYADQLFDKLVGGRKKRLNRDEAERKAQEDLENVWAEYGGKPDDDGQAGQPAERQPGEDDDEEGDEYDPADHPGKPPEVEEEIPFSRQDSPDLYAADPGPWVPTKGGKTERSEATGNYRPIGSGKSGGYADLHRKSLKVIDKMEAAGGKPEEIAEHRQNAHKLIEEDVADGRLSREEADGLIGKKAGKPVGPDHWSAGGGTHEHFADDVKQAIQSMPQTDATKGGAFLGGNKVLISHVIDTLKKKHPNLTDDYFKRWLMHAHHQGSLALSRLDMAGDLPDKEAVRRSETKHPSGYGEWHLITNEQGDWRKGQS